MGIRRKLVSRRAPSSPPRNAPALSSPVMTVICATGGNRWQRHPFDCVWMRSHATTPCTAALETSLSGHHRRLSRRTRRIQRAYERCSLTGPNSNAVLSTIERTDTTLRITEVETIKLGEFPNLLYVRIHTDEGLIGLGETFFG